MATNNLFKNIGLSANQIAESQYFSQMDVLKSDVNSYIPNPSQPTSASSKNIVLGSGNNLAVASVAAAANGNIVIGNGLTSDLTGPVPLETVLSTANGSVLIANGRLPAGSVLADNQLVIMGSAAGRSIANAADNDIVISGYVAPVIEVVDESTHTLRVVINGEIYRIMLTDA